MARRAADGRRRLASRRAGRRAGQATHVLMGWCGAVQAEDFDDGVVHQLNTKSDDEEAVGAGGGPGVARGGAGDGARCQVAAQRSVGQRSVVQCDSRRPLPPLAAAGVGPWGRAARAPGAWGVDQALPPCLVCCSPPHQQLRPVPDPAHGGLHQPHHQALPHRQAAARACGPRKAALVPCLLHPTQAGGTRAVAGAHMWAVLLPATAAGHCSHGSAHLHWLLVSRFTASKELMQEGHSMTTMECGAASSTLSTR